MGGKSAAAGTPMARRLLRATPSLLLYLAAGIAAFFLWPTSLGGCTTLTVVSGASMEPTYFTGDVVVARGGEPQVGDVVVYQPEGYGGVRIIHRVIGGDATGWSIQGDNNSWIDPFAPTNDEILGVAQLHLPKVGLVARALMNPFVWLGLIAIALAILAWPATDDDDDEHDDDERDDDERDDDGHDDAPSETGVEVDGLGRAGTAPALLSATPTVGAR